MTKEFIPYEQALALKELGFDEPCLVVWPGIKGQKLGYDGRYFSLVKGYKNSKLSKEVKRYAPGIIDVAAPLYQQAFRWFREKYGLYQAVYADKRTDDLTLLYKVHVYKLDEELSEYAYRWAKTYEEAEQACLNKLIEIIKNEQSK